jgi:Uma2 family endonuclease
VEALRIAFGPGWLVRVQDPVALDAESEPEPDVAIVPGLPRDSLAEHPARPALLVEVAESSLAFDRDHKGSLYARAEVYHGPGPDRSAEFGWRFLDVQALRRDTTRTAI